MPRMSLPPTPAASTEIRGKDSSPISSTEKSFNLPPPAIESQRIHGASPVIRQPQASASADFFLPPPPTRARTIIQMKPKPQSTGIPARGLTQQGHKGSSKKATSRSTATVAPTKRQPSSTSVAGKKSARKTAHSVIERRRRSKINEEFGTLKAMIPACKEQDMHKLAILQVCVKLTKVGFLSLMWPTGEHRLSSLSGKLHHRPQSCKHFFINPIGTN